VYDVWYLRDAHGSLGPFTKRDLVATIGTYPNRDAVQVSPNRNGPWQRAVNIFDPPNGPRVLWPNAEIATGSNPNPGNFRSDKDVSLSERQVVVDALDRLGSNTNAWEIARPRPVRGAIGFALERPLFDYLTNPERAEVPRGAAALCVFHKNYRPTAKYRGRWIIEPEKYDAFAEQDRNASLRRAEQIIARTSRTTPYILYERGMEFAFMTLLEELGYDVEPLGRKGSKQGGIDVVAERPDPEKETDSRLVAADCKTTMGGFDDKPMMHNLFRSVLASLTKSRELDEVRKIHALVEQHHGVFDYLIVTNREFKLPDFGDREGYFILRGLEVQ
jgi:hypothetical protein